MDADGAQALLWYTTSFMLSPIRIYVVIFSLLVSTSFTPAFAEPENENRLSLYKYKEDPYKPRSLMLPTALSIVVPGFDQWTEGEYGDAIWYTGLGVGGFLITQAARSNLDRRYRNFGLSLYLTAGGLSAFQAFRNTATSRKGIGEFKYLAHDESVKDLLKAPFQFSYLGYWTTLLPLVSGLAIYFLLDSKKGTGTPADFGDLFYASTMSYMTGVSEELLFRGYLMPMIYNYSQNDALSILGQGAAYGIAHGLRFNHFITAFAFGLYSGWIVQKQEWKIGEMIFVHTWLDIMAFIADFAAHREPSFLSIPLVQLTF